MSISDDNAPKHQDRYDEREELSSISRDTVVAAARVVLNGRDPDRIEKLSGGFSNANYLIADGAERLVVRFFPGREAVGEREVGILKLAQKHGLSVPDVVDQLTVGGHACAVMRFVDGALLADLLCSQSVKAQSLFSALGRELALIHSMKFPKAGLFGPDGEIGEEFPDFCAAARDYLLGPLNGLAGKRLGPELTGRVRDAVERHWHLVYDTYAGPSLVHCDFNPKNILISGDAEPRVAAVLDWEFSMSAHPIIDIGNFFRFESEDYPPHARQAFVEGYAQGGGTLPNGWEKAAKLFDLTNMSDFLNRQPEYPKTFRTARRVVESTLEEIGRWA